MSSALGDPMTMTAEDKIYCSSKYI
jgi:hypothetical protein